MNLATVGRETEGWRKEELGSYGYNPGRRHPEGKDDRTVFRASLFLADQERGRSRRL